MESIVVTVSAQDAGLLEAIAGTSSQHQDGNGFDGGFKVVGMSSGPEMGLLDITIETGLSLHWMRQFVEVNSQPVFLNQTWGFSPRIGGK